MNEKIIGSEIIKVRDIYYKPFWFDRHMYFVNFHTGQIYRNSPIYLGDREYASYSDLINYFQDNDITIISANKIIEENK